MFGIAIVLAVQQVDPSAHGKSPVVVGTAPSVVPPSQAPTSVPPVVPTLPPEGPIAPSEPSTPTSAPKTAQEAIWDRLAACIGVTGRGRLGWDAVSWNLYRGNAPADPAKATYTQEMQAGQRLLAMNGGRYVAWSACAAKLGLPY